MYCGTADNLRENNQADDPNLKWDNYHHQQNSTPPLPDYTLPHSSQSNHHPDQNTSRSSFLDTIFSVVEHVYKILLRGLK